MVNFDGDVIGFSAAGRPGGESRPGWKILRRLGGELGLEGFDQVELAELQSDMQAAIDAGKAEPAEAVMAAPDYEDGFYRVGELPMYSVDAQCRRAAPLQATVQAKSDFVGLNPADAGRLGLADGAAALVSQGGAKAEFKVKISDAVPEGAVWLRSATCATRKLGPAIAAIDVEAA